ncbi:MAG: ATP synthase subunit I [Cyanobacteriota bacterium]
MSNSTVDPTPPNDEPIAENSSSSPEAESMQEYYQLKQSLLLVTLAMTGIIFFSVWIFYSLNTALNYLLGACTGVVYLRMLAREVERIGGQKRSLNANRLALVAALIIVASQWQELKIMPIFLGFLTYKAAIIVYVLQTTLAPTNK